MTYENTNSITSRINDRRESKKKINSRGKSVETPKRQLEAGEE